MTVFAGNPNISFCGGTVNDTWVLSNADGTEVPTPTWTLLAPTGGPPSPRWGHSAVYDPATNRMIAFGGNQACVFPDNQVWVLTNANGTEASTPTWTLLTPTGGPPLGRTFHSAGYDPATNRMIVFNGGTAFGAVSEVWVLENANGLGGTPPNWIQQFPTGGPPTSRTRQGVYDPTANRMILFGGGLTATGFNSNEVWVLENANGLGGTPNWTQLFPTGGPPPARGSHSVVLNVGTNRMTVFGGGSNLTVSSLNDVWVLALVVDTDADGIPDAADNCPAVFNPGQEQTGNNVGGPFGDACVDPSADVAPDVTIGAGTTIDKGVVIASGAEIGENVDLNKNSSIGENTVIGDNTVINQGVSIGSDVVIGVNVVIDKGVIIGNGVMIGDNTVIGQRQVSGLLITIDDNAVLGMNVTLGKNVMVNAGVCVADGTTVGQNQIVSVSTCP